jgi:hypothetical protein
MNKIRQWIASLKTLWGGQVSAPVPAIKQAPIDPAIRRQRILQNIFNVDPAAPPKARFPLDNSDGLSEGAKAFADQAAPSASIGASPLNSVDKILDELSDKDPRAKGILADLILHQPLFKDFNRVEGLGRVFEVCDKMRHAGVWGKDIGVLYDICHQNPIKTLGVLYAREHLALVGSGTIKTAIETFGTPDAEVLPVNDLFQTVVDELPKYRAMPASVSLVADKILGQARASENRFDRVKSEPQRILASDSLFVAMSRLADNDKKALGILQALTVRSPLVDRDAFMGPVTPLLALDADGIYGKDIVGLHKACRENSDFMLAVLRANGLGIVSLPTIKAAIATQGKSDAVKLNVDEIMVKVMDQLPNFSYPLRQMPGAGLPKGANLLGFRDMSSDEGREEPRRDSRRSEK